MLRSQFLRLRPKDQPPPSDDVIQQRSAERMAGKDPKALAAVRRSNSDQVVTKAQMRAVSIPTLGIVGTANPYLREFEELRAVMPQLKLVTIEGASHGSTPGDRSSSRPSRPSSRLIPPHRANKRRRQPCKL